MENASMIQLFIPLIGLGSLLAYYFLSSDMKLRKRIQRLEERKRTNNDDANVEYYRWKLHELI